MFSLGPAEEFANRHAERMAYHCTLPLLCCRCCNDAEPNSPTLSMGDGTKPIALRLLGKIHSCRVYICARPEGRIQTDIGTLNCSTLIAELSLEELQSELIRRPLQTTA